MVAVKACSQMEDRNNHLREAEELLSTLLTKMENNTEQKWKDLQRKIDIERCCWFIQGSCRSRGLCLPKIEYGFR